MTFGFTNWDSDKGTLRAGTIYRASSSNDKVWGEENKTNTDIEYGVFVAVNPDGGIKSVSASTDIIHGIVVRDIYGDKAPHNKQVNVGHFSHGDCVGAATAKSETFKRGDKVYIVASGEDAGKVSKTATNNIDLGYWVEYASSGSQCVAITLGYMKK
ncbi:MAG: capsid cement protein [Candidatus Phlomobacter fragariae]